MAYKQKSRPRPLADTDKLCSADEAAELLGVAPQTLAHWRVRGTGPRYITLSARCVRYRASDIRTWLDDRAKDSTAENGRDGQ
ncbi:helix-turn-helix domain-containing protein [Azospirillum sp. RWY-5-1]|uniref:Helix-turn-helix domain-containing protein n=1 Tax=Azospirillum oleiclasticum TaxID=2735135 RepID=A0ABX2TM88_9PROT|nr:helix-turn-helix domain-containing protein [Azospirillum oleiclasticum]NYZ16873.1 helix-turn-helix domain-containing protein [Azospirillum oleiclasticum]NYZ24394.1 helix-turn-helix domain-containing protein [Azospirillum oleiclasticum]